MIKWVVVDIGGVIIPDESIALDKYASELFGLDIDEYKKKYLEYQEKIQCGEVSLKKYFKILSKKGKTDKSIIINYINKYNELILGKEDKGIIDVIKELKKIVKVACLTNTEKEIYKENNRRGRFSIYNKKFISIKMHRRKPHKNVYEYICKILKCEPSEIILIDNEEINFIEARKLGIICILYNYNKGVLEMKKKLNKYNIQLIQNNPVKGKFNVGDNNETKINLFNEINTELRSRRVAEYTYISASVAVFGAIALGFAALPIASNTNKIGLATYAICAILSLGIPVAIKTIKEHRFYKILKQDLKDLVISIETTILKNYYFPNYYKSTSNSYGYLYSLLILLLGGIGSILFIIGIILFYS